MDIVKNIDVNIDIYIVVNNNKTLHLQTEQNRILLKV